MDGARFDRITRAFGRRGTRRSALGLLAGSSLGALLFGGHHDSAAACAKPDAVCTKDNDCCSKVCGQPKKGDRTCRRKDCKAAKYSACVTTADCCDGDCRILQFGGRKKGCVPSNCRNTGLSCGLDNDGKPCCEGQCHHDKDNTGEGKWTCRKPDCQSPDEPCATTTDCCSGRCGCTGRSCTCRTFLCHVVGATCNGEDGDCCEGPCGVAISKGGNTKPTCRRANCHGLGGTCTDTRDCCDGDCGCTNGVCTCRERICGWGVFCTGTTECCQGPCANSPQHGMICRKANCKHQNQSCTDDYDCCKGYCDTAFKVCTNVVSPPP